MANESEVTKIGFRVMIFDTIVCSGLKPSAITLVAISCKKYKPAYWTGNKIDIHIAYVCKYVYK